MPIPKDKRELYGKIIGANLNRGVSKEVAKDRAERGVRSKPRRRRRRYEKG